MLYLVSPSTPTLRHEIKAGRFGAITTPATRYRVAGLPVWAADNACGPSPDFTRFGASYPGDDKWLAWLEAMLPWRDQCIFAVVPDVVCDSGATLERFYRLFPAVRDLRYRVAFAAQNGLRLAEVPWGSIDCLFLGGDDGWKLGPPAVPFIREALKRGLRVHAGRVNGGGRFAYFRALGVHTADGQCINRAPDKNLARHGRWQARAPQEVIF